MRPSAAVSSSTPGSLGAEAHVPNKRKLGRVLQSQRYHPATDRCRRPPPSSSVSWLTRTSSWSCCARRFGEACWCVEEEHPSGQVGLVASLSSSHGMASGPWPHSQAEAAPPPTNLPAATCAPGQGMPAPQRSSRPLPWRLHPACLRQQQWRPSAHPAAAAPVPRLCVARPPLGRPTMSTASALRPHLPLAIPPRLRQLPPGLWRRRCGRCALRAAPSRLRR